jgi:DNA-directed RNA polymerase subunit beta
MEGVVLDNRLFSRMVKTRKGKIKEKDSIKDVEAQFQKESDALKEKLIPNSIKYRGKLSHGVMDNTKSKFIPKDPNFLKKHFNHRLNTVVLNNWTSDSKVNTQVAQAVHNYNEKLRNINITIHT